MEYLSRSLNYTYESFNEKTSQAHNIRDNSSVLKQCNTILEYDKTYELEFSIRNCKNIHAYIIIYQKFVEIFVALFCLFCAFWNPTVCSVILQLSFQTRVSTSRRVMIHSFDPKHLLRVWASDNSTYKIFIGHFLKRINGTFCSKDIKRQ